MQQIKIEKTWHEFIKRNHNPGDSRIEDLDMTEMKEAERVRVLISLTEDNKQKLLPYQPMFKRITKTTSVPP